MNPITRISPLKTILGKFLLPQQTINTTVHRVNRPAITESTKENYVSVQWVNSCHIEIKGSFRKSLLKCI